MPVRKNSGRRHTLFRLACVCGLLLTLPSTATGSAGPDELQSILTGESLPGVVWATVDANSQETGGTGYAELSAARPMTAATRVQVGSITKTLVALGVLQLVSAGELRLSTDVEQLLPGLNWDNPWRREAPITVRNLLEHTAGLDNIRLWQFLNTTVGKDTPLVKAFPTHQEHLLRVRSRPGSQYSYSNMGYALLGLVIERVTSERYEDYLARELLHPLGMHDSSFHFVTQDTDARLAMGYLDGSTPQASVPMFLRPAGQFTTTANDMQRLLRFLLGNGSVGGKELVASGYLDRLGTPSTTDAFRAGLHMGHGLALAARDRHGVLGECHPGTTFGFRAQLCVFRAQEKAFFYAVNADSERADYERLTAHFIDRIAVEAAARSPELRLPLDAYTGLYELAPANMAQFAWLDWMFNSVWLAADPKRGGLVMHTLQRPERLLLPMGDGLFRDADRRVASHVVFGVEETLLSNGLTTWRKASTVKLFLAWASLTAGVLGLLYIVVRGIWLLLGGRLLANGAIAPPWVCLIAFTLPVFLYGRQSFLQFGERTEAGLLLAGLSAALPLALGIALYGIYRSPVRPLLDLCAVLAGLQLCVVLLWQGVLPIVFWR
mgnify:CR=1 FL=1